MNLSFDDAIVFYEQQENNFNEAKRRFFIKNEGNLFFSSKIDDYEFHQENYFLSINKFFLRHDFSCEIEKAFDSKDKRLRINVLKITKDCILSEYLIYKLSPKILISAITGSEDEAILARKILKRRFNKKNHLIDCLSKLAPELLRNFHNDDENYHIYKYMGQVIVLLKAREIFSQYLEYGFSSSKADIRELAEEFKEKMADA
jgi:hypothetical protein